MGRQSAIFNITEDAQLPYILFIIDGVEESDFSEMILEVKRNDGRILTKTAVVDDPGQPGTNIPMTIHFEWSAGDIISGNHRADLVLAVGGEPMRLPEINPILIVARKKR